METVPKCMHALCKKENPIFKAGNQVIGSIFLFIFLLSGWAFVESEHKTYR
jgi:hypothetical protein